MQSLWFELLLTEQEENDFDGKYSIRNSHFIEHESLIKVASLRPTLLYKWSDLSYFVINGVNSGFMDTLVCPVYCSSVTFHDEIAQTPLPSRIR